MNNTRGYEPWNRSLILLGGTNNKAMIMKMTKALTMTWIPPTDPECAIRAHHERAIQAIYTELDGKTNSDNNVRIDDHTIQRQWRDQAAVDEFIEFMYNLSVKYGGTVVVGKTINL